MTSEDTSNLVIPEDSERIDARGKWYLCEIIVLSCKRMTTAVQ